MGKPPFPATLIIRSLGELQRRLPLWDINLAQTFCCVIIFPRLFMHLETLSDGPRVG
jgi:hypothetical protein